MNKQEMYLVEYRPNFVDVAVPQNIKKINSEDEVKDIVNAWKKGQRKDCDIEPPRDRCVGQKFIFAKNKIVIALIHYYE